MKEEKALSSCTSWAIFSLISGEKNKAASPKASPHMSLSSLKGTVPVMLAIPCSSAGEAQLPAAEALEVQAAKKMILL